MSNDSKFWISRGAVFACIAADLFVLSRIMAAGWDPDQPGWLFFWFIILLLVTTASIPLAFRYYRTKDNRWRQSQADANKLAIETLAELGKQRKKSDNSTGKQR
jgi:hypothetical protein